ncbi:SRPBCC family protein [Reichenbachiella ulvae]|uniref:SRPBCC family protein n=1 Tax=Reichenbachiella ulvae TaxID=2980104 RepID=A0ABT3CQ13_9BACT|nr:SRPBCC family protein [Reichenbachiella ulvae]MCV9385712.1 SRPBCC family protein [Reichenbachiella ulvae]
MKALKIIIQVIVISMGVLALIGWFLPREVSLERSISIDASPQKIYDVTKDFRQMYNWSPWHKIDPDGTQYEFEGPDGEVGMKMSWESEHEKVGKGSQEIIELEESELVKTEMYFEGFDAPSYASFIIKEENGSSNVTWTYEGDLGPNPYMHYFGLMMESMLGPSYEEGLADLKTYVEGLPEEIEHAEMTIESDSTMMGIDSVSVDL